MNGPATALALALAILVQSIVVAIILIPWLDEKRRKAIARKEAVEAAANDDRRAVRHDPKRHAV